MTSIESHSAYDELAKQSKRAARMLGVSHRDLHLINNVPNISMTYKYNSTETDIIIQRRGLRKTLPFVRSPSLSKKYKSGKIGEGLMLCKTKTLNILNHPIYYVLVSIPSEEFDTNLYYVFVRKKDLYRLVTYWKKLDRKKTINPEESRPILYDNFLNDIINSSVKFFLRNNELSAYGAKLKQGILLDGDPGNGKTMTMRYINKLCIYYDIDCNIITAKSLENAYRDNSLEALMGSSPVLFFDDIDTSFFNRNRAEGGDGRMCCALLSAMDGMGDQPHSIRVFTTNESVKNLDPAFKRPGRIDRVFEFGPPDFELRKRLIKTWHEEITSNVGIDRIAEITDGFSFAQVDAIKNFLVMNYVFNDDGWNLDKAITMFYQGERGKQDIQNIQNIQQDEQDEQDEQRPFNLEVKGKPTYR